MTPRKKRIKDMTAEEAARLTDDQVMEKVFDKRTAKKLRKAVEESGELTETKGSYSHK